MKRVFNVALLILSLFLVISCTKDDGPNPDDNIVCEAPYFIDDKLIDTYIEPTEVLVGWDKLVLATDMFVPDINCSPDYTDIQFSGIEITESSNPELFEKYRAYYDDYSPDNDKILSSNYRKALGYLLTSVSIKTLDDFSEEYPAGSCMDKTVVLMEEGTSTPNLFLQNKSNWEKSNGYWQGSPFINYTYDNESHIIPGAESCVVVLSDITKESPRKLNSGDWGMLGLSFTYGKWKVEPALPGTYRFEISFTLTSPISGKHISYSRTFSIDWK